MHGGEKPMWQLAWIHFYGKFSQHLGLERGACLKHAGTGKGKRFFFWKNAGWPGAVKLYERKQK
jgi:hypothetical protein